MSSSQAFADRVTSLPCPSCLTAVNVASVEPLTTIPCPSCGKDIDVPGIVGSLVLKKLLGRGTAGIVYQAFDKHLNKDVAVKVFLKQSGPTANGGAGGSVDIVEKCLAEARAMTALSHPNIVEIYSVAKKNERPFIVMELLTGDRLDTIIASHLLVEEHRALRMAIDVASGLQAVHNAGFAHLDVKPANIQMTGQGICKLLDYDTARSQRDIETSGAGLVGTPYYVAPEIIRRMPVDFRADMYSLGATLFHLIAQRPPFQGDSPREVVQQRLKRKAINLREIRSDVSEATASVINRMLEAEPVDRYANYDLLLADLRKAQQFAVDRALKPAAAGHKARGSSSAKAAPVMLLAGVAIICAIIAAVWFGTRPGSNEEMGKDSALVTAKDQSGVSYKDSVDVLLPVLKDGAAKDARVTKDAKQVKDRTSLKDAKEEPPPVTIRPIENIKPIEPLPPVRMTKDKEGVGTKVDDPLKGNPEKPLVKQIRDAAQVDGWQAGKQVTLKHKPGILEVWCVGDEPSIRMADLRGGGEQSDGAIIEIRLKASGKGDGQLQWRSEKFPEFDDSRARPIPINHDSEWHDYLIAFPAKGQALELRLDLGDGAGIFEIESIKFFADAKAIRPAQQWNFE